MGESSRSGYERGGEHVSDCLARREDSHMWKHMQDAHAGEKTPDFSFKVIKTFQSALMRQVSEAVRVEKRGKVLNSKGIYNRCSLPRLTVQQNNKVVEPDKVEDDERSYSFPCTRETGVKRGGEESGRREDQPAHKRKKWCGQYGEGEVWGEKGLEGNVATFLYSTQRKVGGKMKQAKLKVLHESEVVARSMVEEVLEGTHNLISLVVEKDEDNWLVEELNKFENQMEKKLELDTEEEKLEIGTAERGKKRKFLVKLQPPAPAKKRKVEQKKRVKIAPSENPVKHLWEKLKTKNENKKIDGEKVQQKEHCLSNLVSDSHAIGVEFDKIYNFPQSTLNITLGGETTKIKNLIVPGCAVGVECGKYPNNALRGEKRQISKQLDHLTVLNDTEGQSLNLRSNSRQLDSERERESGQEQHQNL